MPVMWVMENYDRRGDYLPASLLCQDSIILAVHRCQSLFPGKKIPAQGTGPGGSMVMGWYVFRENYPGCDTDRPAGKPE